MNTDSTKTDLLKIIEDKIPTLSKGHRRIATYIVEHYDKAAYMTAGNKRIHGCKICR